ncbi:unnamed protein product [Ambrosiozyma monospora]|uniref:Unnamed protein product n=1 Tax=Ambrosiozyma monospora TaxID=43982 RepID=A0ACB5TK62_AMBMO|nr:unnamed protein product [Ambrosiozyma monospora]
MSLEKDSLFVDGIDKSISHDIEEEKQNDLTETTTGNDTPSNSDDSRMKDTPRGVANDDEGSENAFDSFQTEEGKPGDSPEPHEKEDNADPKVGTNPLFVADDDEPDFSF